ncbi:hypothetical protein VA7868_02561 [Vibrio aerogenes CECT 7868]|uniref:Type II secretion system protein K n=1 Tax=Vibrio aerogenes CECT 7868 TaxID=1216006 RepID=A0A1M5ZCK6_9VIBR|nr:type II secretion system protein GspK [Vibrio aerogenes]SHI21931.1 hypothetical protein VA7868_02561 [Vibrio aerogenes CECT 7868]
MLSIKSRKHRQSGIVLPLTLIILAVLTLMASSLLSKGQDQSDKAFRLNQQWQARLAINNAEQRVLFAMMVGDQLPGGYQLGDTVLLTDSSNTKLSNGVWVSLQDHAGLVSLSFIDKSILTELVRSYIPGPDAVRVTQAIIDWQRRPENGSQLPSYDDQVLPRNSPFRSLDELMLIPGITSQIYNGRRNLAEAEENPQNEAGSLPELPKFGLRDLLSVRGAESDGINFAAVPDAILSRAFHVTPYNLDVLRRMKQRGNWAGIRRFLASNNISTGAADSVPSSFYTIRFQYHGIQARGIYRVLPRMLPTPRLIWYFPDNFRYFSQPK